MVYEIECKSSVQLDLKQLNKKTAERILSRVEEISSREPNAGERLHGEFPRLYKQRICDYRVVYTIIKDIVLILRLGHRGKIYE